MDHIKFDQVDSGNESLYSFNMSHSCILNEYKDYLANIFFLLQSILDNNLDFPQKH